jgi:glutaredoxin 2
MFQNQGIQLKVQNINFSMINEASTDKPRNRLVQPNIIKSIRCDRIKTTSSHPKYFFDKKEGVTLEFKYKAKIKTS